MTYTTAARPFFETVSRDLCEKERVTTESVERALSFIARSAATGITIAGAGTLFGLGLVAGSPLVALGVSAAGLSILPPLAERAARGTASLLGEIALQIGGFVRGDE